MTRSDELKQIVKLDQSAVVVDAILSSPDKGIPREILERAVCVVILPGMQSYTLFVGVEWGSGFVSCRKTHGGGWTAPGAVSLKGGSFGLQVGARQTDLLLVMNRPAEEKLLGTDFTIGRSASAAAGPVGRSVGAATNATLDAGILSWSRTAGFFAGISLQGAMLQQDTSALRVLYGDDLSNREVVLGRRKVPPNARRLIDVLNRYSPNAS